MSFNDNLNKYLEKINQGLTEVSIVPDCLQKEVYEAMSYSLLAGGKRMRPVLTLAVSDMLGGNIDNALKFAIPIECIHTYSLIHDDLPCMDNDDMRRGMPTCHKKFNETTALLAGDGLLTFAFEYITELGIDSSMSAESILKATNLIAKCAGCDGMIGGQVVDLASEGKTDISRETLTYMHNRKTGALIKAAVLVGAISASANDEQLRILESFADNLGIAFQIQDDILDCIGDAELLGKPIGSDAENEKTTFVTLLGLEKAKEEVKNHTAAAISELHYFGKKAKFLKDLSLMLLNREN